MKITEEMVERAAEALWSQARSNEYPFFTPAAPCTWQTEDERAKEVARDLARAALGAAFGGGSFA